MIQSIGKKTLRFESPLLLSFENLDMADGRAKSLAERSDCFAENQGTT